jgi:nicotinamidase-related amidase
MARSATLLMDLQFDFLAAEGGRMPVFPADASRVINAANAVLAGRSLTGSLPILIVNEFPASERIANLFRHNAAVEGTPGADLDQRVQVPESIPVLAKRHPSAFTNADLEPYLRANAVSKVYVMGVFAEGCVRATALDAKRRGYEVAVPLEAVGTNAEFKRRLAQWAMRRAGVQLLPELPAAANAT